MRSITPIFSKQDASSIHTAKDSRYPQYWELVLVPELAALRMKTGGKQWEELQARAKGSAGTGKSPSLSDYMAVFRPEALAALLKLSEASVVEGESITLQIGKKGKVIGMSYRHLPVLEQTPSDLLVPTDLDASSLLKQEHVSGAKSLTHSPALPALAGMSFVHKRHAETGLLAPHWLGGGAACGEGVIGGEGKLPPLLSPPNDKASSEEIMDWFELELTNRIQNICKLLLNPQITHDISLLKKYLNEIKMAKTELRYIRQQIKIEKYSIEIKQTTQAYSSTIILHEKRKIVLEINYRNSSLWDYSLLAHELKHLYAYLCGEEALSISGNTLFETSDIWDEMEGYIRGACFRKAESTNLYNPKEFQYNARNDVWSYYVPYKIMEDKRKETGFENNYRNFFLNYEELKFNYNLPFRITLETTLRQVKNVGQDKNYSYDPESRAFVESGNRYSPTRYEDYFKEDSLDMTIREVLTEINKKEKRKGNRPHAFFRDKAVAHLEIVEDCIPFIPPKSK